MEFKPFLWGLFVCLCFTNHVLCVTGAVEDAVDTANDLVLEPLNDIASDAVDAVRDTVSDTLNTASELSEKMLDPYHEVMEMFQAQSMEDFTEDILDRMLDKFTSSFHCNSGVRKRSTGCTKAIVSISCLSETQLIIYFPSFVRRGLKLFAEFIKCHFLSTILLEEPQASVKAL